MKSISKLIWLALLIVACATTSQDQQELLKDLGAEYGQLLRKGRYAEAEEVARHTLIVTEQSFGPDHPATARALNNLAVANQARGKYAEAEILYRRSLAIDEKTFGKNHPYVVQTLNNLAAIYQTQGRYADAETFYMQALEILEQTLGENHPDVAVSLKNLGGLYHEKRDFTSALTYYTKAAAINPDYKFKIIPLLDELGKWQDIIQLAAPEIKNENISPSLLGPLATAYQQTGQIQEAEAVIRILKNADYPKQWQRDYRNYVLAYYYLWHDKTDLSKECLRRIMIPRYLKYARTAPKFQKLFSDPEFLELTAK
ncbi:MAG: tetratricopeptide repeat protein [Desulfobacterales bacterium]|jgi:tetratricopeptide (TPR) repeat protein